MLQETFIVIEYLSRLKQRHCLSSFPHQQRRHFYPSGPSGQSAGGVLPAQEEIQTSEKPRKTRYAFPGLKCSRGDRGDVFPGCRPEQSHRPKSSFALEAKPAKGLGVRGTGIP